MHSHAEAEASSTMHDVRDQRTQCPPPNAVIRESIVCVCVHDAITEYFPSHDAPRARQYDRGRGKLTSSTSSLVCEARAKLGRLLRRWGYMGRRSHIGQQHEARGGRRANTERRGDGDRTRFDTMRALQTGDWRLEGGGGAGRPGKPQTVRDLQ
ncbi:hypothetical protein K466DRAFT_404566 [Polyporus arcularius HHB13444]|uniref:Uncharacterized protein n=1 Tax=Polyporus arcularius HHB13444 TaxID=1314778 RepID=A0A5C3PLE1_9APHY|nr:hypothetical protein K466DRAFT_404566 [Polyporus arcularius HHB13444]